MEARATRLRVLPSGSVTTGGQESMLASKRSPKMTSPQTPSAIADVAGSARSRQKSADFIVANSDRGAESLLRGYAHAGCNRESDIRKQRARVLSSPEPKPSVWKFPSCRRVYRRK